MPGQVPRVQVLQEDFLQNKTPGSDSSTSSNESEGPIPRINDFDYQKYKKPSDSACDGWDLLKPSRAAKRKRSRPERVRRRMQCQFLDIISDFLYCNLGQRIKSYQGSCVRSDNSASVSVSCREMNAFPLETSFFNHNHKQKVRVQQHPQDRWVACSLSLSLRGSIVQAVGASVAATILSLCVS